MNTRNKKNGSFKHCMIAEKPVENNKMNDNIINIHPKTVIRFGNVIFSFLEPLIN